MIGIYEIPFARLADKIRALAVLVPTAVWISPVRDKNHLGVISPVACRALYFQAKPGAFMAPPGHGIHIELCLLTR
tara:strand:- start:35600 stop:35827 length:228 start_codon:yes stop_codon:yes gene_type:complete